MVSNKEQFGFPRNIEDIKGITIHNTGNELSARENYEIMESTSLSSATHYFVDEKDIIQAMPDDYAVYHTGMAIDWACKHTLVIEICRSQSNFDTYIKAEKRAVRLAKRLMKKYNLEKDCIYFHKDFHSKNYCPHRILDLYSTKKEFIRRYF